MSGVTEEDGETEGQDLRRASINGAPARHGSPESISGGVDWTFTLRTFGIAEGQWIQYRCPQICRCRFIYLSTYVTMWRATAKPTAVERKLCRLCGVPSSRPCVPSCCLFSSCLGALPAHKISPLFLSTIKTPGRSALGPANSELSTGEALLTSAAIRYGVVLTDPFGKGRLRGTFEYTIDWLPIVLMIHPSVIYGAGIAPVGFKWNFLANPRHRPYAEVDFGGVFSTHSIPPGDSTINFTTNAGGGLTLLNRGNETLSAGFNFSHLSCGFLCSRNPNLNGVSFVLEYRWLKAK